MSFFHSVPQFFQYRVILLFVLSSPMHMTAAIYNKPLFRHETEGKNSKEKETKHFPVLISTSQTDSQTGTVTQQQN